MRIRVVKDIWNVWWIGEAKQLDGTWKCVTDDYLTRFGAFLAVLRWKRKMTFGWRKKRHG